MYYFFAYAQSRAAAKYQYLLGFLHNYFYFCYCMLLYWNFS